MIRGSLPFLMAGGLAVGRSLIALLTAEMSTVVAGVGALLIRYSGAPATDMTFALAAGWDWRVPG